MSGALLISKHFLKVIQLFERNHKRKKIWSYFAQSICTSIKKRRTVNVEEKI